MKKRYWLAALLGVVLAVMTITGRPAHAQVQRYMCPVDTYCQFSGDFYTGQVHEVDGITVTQNLGHWRQIPAGKRASANDNTAYQINYYSAQTGSVASFHDRFEAGGQYGWWCSGSWSGCNHDLPGVVQKARLTSAKRFMCSTGFGCLYDCVNAGADYNAGQNDLQWIQIGSQYRGCATNHSGRNLWTVNYQEDVWTCFHAKPDTPYKGTTLAAGWFYFNGSGGCSTCPPDLMGQHCPGAQIIRTADKVVYKSAKTDPCPQGPPNWTACFWPNFDGSGSPYQAHPSGGLDTWRTIPSPDRASLSNLTQYTVWVYAVSGSGAGTYGCVDAGDFRVDGGVHGKFWMGDFGTCESGFQPLPPT